MKNISLILNIVLFIAVGYLYVQQFSGNEAEMPTNDGVATSVSSGKLAYVNSDSLLTNYDYYKEVSKTLQEKRALLEQEYNQRAQALQGQVDDYQKTYLNMTVPQARAVEEDLMGKRQELAVFQESVSQQLMREEAQITTQLYENISNYLKGYGDENNLEIVFTYSPGSGLIYANSSLDITSNVIEALNDEYQNGDSSVKTDSIQ